MVDHYPFDSPIFGLGIDRMAVGVSTGMAGLRKRVFPCRLLTGVRGRGLFMYFDRVQKLRGAAFPL
jgi:hypothetical protein